VRTAAKQQGVRAHVLGFRNQSELPAAYATADLLVLPSREPSETWGLVVNEGFACGLPAVVSDAAGCAPDLITEGQSGSVFAPGDCSALGRALRSHANLRARPETQARLAELSEAHSPTNAARLMLAAVQQAGARGRRA
jgi:glycosyltransferase involved in cell wall biosynthesis